MSFRAIKLRIAIRIVQAETKNLKNLNLWHLNETAEDFRMFSHTSASQSLTPMP
jgi:hypothetical protein